MNLPRGARNNASGAGRPCSLPSVAHSIRGLVHVSKNNCCPQRSSIVEQKARYTGEETRAAEKGQSLNNPTSGATGKSKSRPSDMWTLRALSAKGTTQVQRALEGARQAVVDWTLNFWLKIPVKMPTTSKCTNRRCFNYASKCWRVVQIPKSKVFSKLLLRLKCSFLPVPFPNKGHKTAAANDALPTKATSADNAGFVKAFQSLSHKCSEVTGKISHLTLHPLAHSIWQALRFPFSPSSRLRWCWPLNFGRHYIP